MEPLTRVRPQNCNFSLEVPSRLREWFEVTGFETTTSSLFSTVVVDADVILDIGSHSGYYSLLAKSASPSAAVIAIEAGPENAELVRRNVLNSGLGEIRVIHGAFGGQPKTVPIRIAEAFDNSGLTPHPASSTIAKVQVPRLRLLDLDLPSGTRVVVKLDIGGHETDAVSQLSDLREKFTDFRLFVKLNPTCLTAAGTSADELLEKLFALGLRLFLLQDNPQSWQELRKETYWSTLLDVDDGANLYCVPRELCHSVGGLLHSGDLGGAELTHVELVQTLVNKGSMVHSVIPEPDRGLSQRLLDVGGSVSIIPADLWWAATVAESTAPAIFDWMNHPLDVQSQFEVFKRLDVDVILTQTGVLPHGAVTAAALGKPHVWYLHELGDPYYGILLPGEPKSFGLTVRALSDAVIVASEAIADRFFSDDGVVEVVNPAPRVRVTSPMIPLQPSQGSTFGVIGALHEGKGQEQAISAVARLCQDNSSIKLKLIGRGTRAQIDHLVSRTHVLGVEGHVEFCGHVADRAAIYGELDVVIVTSAGESFGRIPFEATAFGKPVVYAAGGGHLDYMTDGVTGLAFTPGSVEQLSTAVRRLLLDQDLRQRLVSGARRHLLDPRRQTEFGDRLDSALWSVRRRPAPSPLQDLLGAAVRTHLNASAEVERLRSNLKETQDANDELQTRNASLKLRLKAKRQALSNARAVLSKSQDKARRLEVQFERLTRQADRLSSQRLAMKNSRTWRYRAKVLRLIRRN